VAQPGVQLGRRLPADGELPQLPHHFYYAGQRQRHALSPLQQYMFLPQTLNKQSFAEIYKKQG
jgi:hypothetical protein